MNEIDRQFYKDMGRHQLRDDIRAIMRGKEVTNSHGHDLIREVTEWHDEGRPNFEETKRRVQAEAAERRELKPHFLVESTPETYVLCQDLAGCEYPKCDCRKVAKEVPAEVTKVEITDGDGNKLPQWEAEAFLSQIQAGVMYFPQRHRF